MTIALPRLDRSTGAERGITLADFLVPIRVGERLGTRVRHIALVLAGGRWEIATAVPWPAVGAAFALGVVLAMFAAAYPARLASGVSIVRAVGYE